MRWMVLVRQLSWFYLAWFVSIGSIVHITVGQCKVIFGNYILNTMNSYADSFDLSYNDKRLLLNASEHLIIIQKISAAKKADNRVDFDKAVEDLSKAAAF